MAVRPANEGRLPQWAQERLESYRNEIMTLRNRLKAVAEGTEKTPFYYEYFDPYGGSMFFHLPRLTRLQHCNGDPTDARNVLEFQDDSHERDPGWVKVYAHDGKLHVEPVAANVIRIKVERHR